MERWTRGNADPCDALAELPRRTSDIPDFEVPIVTGTDEHIRRALIRETDAVDCGGSAVFDAMLCRDPPSSSCPYTFKILCRASISYTMI